MESFHRLDLRLQCFPQAAGPEGRAVLTALAALANEEVLALP
jgi:hypothetical protein